MDIADAPGGRWLTRATLSELPLLTEEERGLIVEEWNATRNHPQTTIHALFSDANQLPGSRCSRKWRQRLTYLS